MKTLKEQAKAGLPVLVLLAMSVILTYALAGNLEPTNPPGPTMKTLTDVEPRTAIYDTSDTLTPIVISEPGSYYLAENIYALHSNHGIEITADNVTLDLNGFTIFGNTEVGSLDGIHASTVDKITVMNGTVQDFFDFGLILGEHSIVINVRAMNNGSNGIYVDLYSMVRDCIAAYNTEDGIGSNLGTVIGCLAHHNDQRGMVSGTSTVFQNCSSSFNGTDGFEVTRGVVRGCVAANNTEDGISPSSSLVQGNAAGQNDEEDIVNDAFSTIIENDT